MIVNLIVCIFIAHSIKCVKTRYSAFIKIEYSPEIPNSTRNIKVCRTIIIKNLYNRSVISYVPAAGAATLIISINVITIGPAPNF